MHCCGPHGAYGMFLAWNNIVSKSENKVSVNLLINRDSAIADVRSYLPYEGKAEITPKSDCTLSINLPVKAAAERIKVTAGGVPANFTLDGARVVLENAAKDRTVTVEFPNEYKTDKQTINGEEYSLTWRGNTVVEIDPAGTVAPLFKREHFKQDKAPLLPNADFTYLENPIDW